MFPKIAAGRWRLNSVQKILLRLNSGPRRLDAKPVIIASPNSQFRSLAMSFADDFDPQPTDASWGRRELLAYTAAFGTAFLAGQGLVTQAAADEKSPAPKP